MKKLKKVFCLIFICMLVLSGCNNKVDVKGDNKSEIQVSSNLNTDKQNEEKNSTTYADHIRSLDSNTSDKKIISDIKIDDNLSMNDNNSSAFCYRIIKGSNKISNHGKGMAIDINPFQNPHVIGETTNPVEAYMYSDRTIGHTGIIIEGDDCYNAFVII